jgi:hypothetical protein
MADITPLPKETPFKTCNQYRPILLTNIIMRLFERVVFKSELSNNVNNFIGSDQFAYRKGYNTIPWPWLSVSTNGLNGLIVMLILLGFFFILF